MSACDIVKYIFGLTLFLAYYFKILGSSKLISVFFICCIDWCGHQPEVAFKMELMTERSKQD